MLLPQAPVHRLNGGVDEGHPAVLFLAEAIQDPAVEDEEEQHGAPCAEGLPERVVVLQTQVAPEPAEGDRRLR